MPQLSEKDFKICADVYKYLSGDKESTLKPISNGIQNYNFFVVSKEGEITDFWSIMRFGQGEITTKEHQQQILDALTKMDALLHQPGIEMPVPLGTPVASKEGEMLETVPDYIGGERIPGEIAGKFAVKYTLLRGREVKLASATPEDYKMMGRMHGKFLAAGEKLVDEDPAIAGMQNPVSFENLQGMVKKAMGFAPELPLKDILSEENKSEMGEHLQKVSDKLKERVARKKKEDPSSKSIGIVEGFIEDLEGGWYQETLKKLVKANEIWEKKGFANPDKLRRGLVHGDVHFGNLYLPDGKNKGGMYDLGWAGVGPEFIDFMQPLVLNCSQEDGSLSVDKAKDYFTGLQEERPLTDFEKDNFSDMLRMTFFRSTATRLMSMVESGDISSITKGPVELTKLLDNFIDMYGDFGADESLGESITRKDVPSKKVLAGAELEGALNQSSRKRGASHL